MLERRGIFRIQIQFFRRNFLYCRFIPASPYGDENFLSVAKMSGIFRLADKAVFLLPLHFDEHIVTAGIASVKGVVRLYHRSRHFGSNDRFCNCLLRLFHIQLRQLNIGLAIFYLGIELGADIFFFLF